MTSAGGAAQCVSCSAEALEFVPPLHHPSTRKTARAGDPGSGAGIRFCFLPRADALGYLLNAPPALGDLVHGAMDRPYSHQEFLQRDSAGSPQNVLCFSASCGASPVAS